MHKHLKKQHELKLTSGKDQQYIATVKAKVEFVSSNYFAITFPKMFLPFDYRWNTFDEITVYADVYPDWSITVGKHSNEDKDVFNELMDNHELVEGIRYLLFRGNV
tara:strand:- start:56 stop:373 length:318 start_codon:yes stop_codon:yes gene_type:complete